MSKKELNELVDDVVPANVVYENGELAAKIVKDGDEYFIETLDGVRLEAKITDDKLTLMLSPNPSNRKWFNIARCEAAIAEQGFCPLTYKATKVLGPQGSRSTKMPNEKLIAYLSPEEQEEYKAIIARAIAARDADKAKPMTEREKLEAKIAKAKAALAKLEAEAQD